MNEVRALLIAAAQSKPAGGGQDAANALIALVAIFVATKLLGEIAQRFRQPTVLGELIAGVLLGGSVLGVVDPTDPVIATLAQLGVVVLLFEIGLETELAALIRVGRTATTVAVAGVALPLTLGYFAASALGLAQIPALVCGAALCATSAGISARIGASSTSGETAVKGSPRRSSNSWRLPRSSSAANKPQTSTDCLR